MAERMKKRADGRYTLKVATPEGPRFVYGKTQAETKKKAQELRERVKAGAPVRDSSRTLGEWLDEWQRTTLAASNRAESTKVRHRGDIRRWITPVIGDVPLDKLLPSDIARVMSAMKEAGRADSTRRNTYDCLSVALDDAVDNKLITTNPAHKPGRDRGRRAMRPKGRSGEARHLKPQEAARLLQCAKTLRYVDAIRLILLTGLRRGEAFGLRWADVDLEEREARVRGSLGRLDGALRYSDTKTDHSRRTIALSDSAVALLKAHRAAQNEERLKAGDRWEASGYVFTTVFGKPAEPHNLLRAVKSAADKAGLSDVKVHTLRHTYATTALRAGVPLKVVSVNLGHTSTQVTADIYQHVVDEMKQEAAQAVSAAYGF